MRQQPTARTFPLKSPLGIAKHYFRLSCYGLRTAGFIDSIAAFSADITNAKTVDDQFDVVHGTETAATAFPWDVGMSDREARQAVVYMPTDATSFDAIFEASGLTKEDLRQFAFVDFGAGKGRVLLLARQYPFASVTGVELSPSLVATARENIQRCRGLPGRCGQIEVRQENAVNFQLPGEALVLFFYHPFVLSTMRAVMSNILASLDAGPRDAFILYRHPVFGRRFPDGCMGGDGRFRKVAEQPSCRASLTNGWSVWRARSDVTK